ncbi:hypothetical protein MJO29_005636 [Puccinia striiformis f. sp. tritici]|nr:hypothetical protein MJO29_005636 [Puccinia striiformis f. sp. tritici]
MSKMERDFCPRILTDVSNINHSTPILGTKSTVPLYITTTAPGKLGHPEGKKNLAIAAESEDIIQMISRSSCNFNDLIDIKKEKLTSNRKIKCNGVKAMFITVDVPQSGRREKDMRLKSSILKDKVDRSQGATQAISSFIDPPLNWSDLEWLKSITTLPFILKGVQTWEDVVLAQEHNLSGMVISHHGGRQLDNSLSAIEILISIVSELKTRKMYNLQEFAIFNGVIDENPDFKACQNYQPLPKL